MWKNTLGLIILFSGFYLSLTGQNRFEDINDFQDNKLGIFIHWGLYSQTAGVWKGKPSRGGEHFMLYEKIPLKEYALIAEDFNPENFNASEWVQAVKEAGMKYIVYTTKHHDGFAMYESKCSDYNIVKKTPFKRDPLKELAEACKKEGIKLGLYYSLGRDWEDPDVPTNWPHKGGRSNLWDYPDEDAKVLSNYLERKVKPQITELLTGYGEIAMMWFDTYELVNKEQSQEIRTLIKSIQPKCLINNRIGGGMGDYRIVEQQLINKIDSRPWEACLTMGKNWGYNQFDTIYKSPVEIICHMTDIVSKGGNLLLNIGPTGKGNFPPQSMVVLKEMRTWLQINGEAIYSTRPWRVFGENLTKAKTKEINKEFHDAEYDGTPKEFAPDVRFTKKGNFLYAIIRNMDKTEYTIKSINNSDKIQSIKLIETGKEVEWRLNASGLKVKLQKNNMPKHPVYVLKIEL